MVVVYISFFFNWERLYNGISSLKGLEIKLSPIVLAILAITTFALAGKVEQQCKNAAFKYDNDVLEHEYSSTHNKAKLKKMLKYGRKLAKECPNQKNAFYIKGYAGFFSIDISNKKLVELIQGLK